MLPHAFTSLKSAVYCGLVKAGGPEGRNCCGDWIAHGATYENCTPAAGRNAGGVGRQTPGADPPKNGGGGGVNPSVLRHARMAFATVCPQAAPRAIETLCSTPEPLAIEISEATKCRSKVVFCDG